MRQLPFLGFLLLVLLFKNTLAYTPVDIPKGYLIKSESIGTYNEDKLRKISNEELQQFLYGAPTPFENYKGKFSSPINGLTLYKLTYQTSIPEKQNKKVTATGLIAIPNKIGTNMPMISYQHGTVFGKQEVPSNIEASMEMKLILAQFGGQGFICIGADYIGLGDSKEPNSYFARKATEEACFDMYKAALQFLKQKNIQVSHFFTMGWSQGAYNNMLFLRKLEEAKVNVTASATAAAPVDLNLFLTRGLVNPRPIDAVYTPAAFGNLLFSFEHYYNKPGFAKRVIRPEFYTMAYDFYNFKLDFMDYMQKSTTKAVDFIKPEFIQKMKTGNSEITKLLNESEAYRWLSVTPFRAYYGMKDEAVPSYIASLAVEYQKLLGKTDAEAFNAGENADHRNTYIQALIEVQPWFKSFVK